MVDTVLLQEEMRSRGYTLERIALELGRSRTCIFNKIHNKSEFRASEVNKIARVLKLSKAQTNRIFFA
jgi:cyanate lyase